MRIVNSKRCFQAGFVFGFGLLLIGCGSHSSSPAAPTISSIAVTPATPSVVPTTTQQFNATGTYSDGTTKDLTTTVTWSSSATTVAAINNAGLATSAAAGATTIKATSGATNGSTTFTVAPGFTTTGSLVQARAGCTSTLLTNGMVLIAGGDSAVSVDGGGTLNSAELYNPANGTFTATGSMNAAREYHTATLLDNGFVLIAGGRNATSSSSVILSSAELYNPATGTFTSTGSMSTPRLTYGQTIAALLNSGMVLFVGGRVSDTGPVITATAELYNPATGTFTATGSMSIWRENHSVTRLADGMVLVVGGIGYVAPSETTFASAELYNPATGTFSVTGNMSAPRSFHTATVLNDGMVLVAGGRVYLGPSVLATAELYSPTSGSFAPTGSLGTARTSSTATLLNNGFVLVAGGLAASNNLNSDLNSSELYSSGTGTFAAAGPLGAARDRHVASLLNNGAVLFVGGESAPSNILSSAELFQPGLPSLQSISITPASPTISVGGSQALVATVTFSDGTSSPVASAIWSSSSASVAEVTNDASNKGTVLGVTAGTTSITATIGSVTASSTVTVQ